jgi:predicted ATPase/DNA-binding winged helix-turn-helix (wHTH) protein
MDHGSARPAGIALGRFQVLPDRREVLADGRPVKLGGRAFDVLMALIEARGAVISKEALMARVWPGRIVEENSLAAQISALRAAFGAERALIRTVSGRGYQLGGDIRMVPAGSDQPVDAAAAQPVPVQPPTNVPEPISELIGREEELSEILNLAGAHRLVTLTGAGGIGKTTLALALARELRPHFADGVWLAEFSALADPGLVPATVAAAVGLELGGGEPSAQRVAQALAGRCLLVVLDTCEHVIAAAAAMAEAMLGAGTRLHIIATSREALRAGGEWLYPVQPLAVPATDLAPGDGPLRYGAVQLFVERARAAEPHFAPDRRLTATIAAICRRLDGIPLAIELAAARASALGIEELASRLDDRFLILSGGRRTAFPRHRTLRAALDWSYELLSEPERVILRRLAVFAGAFGLDAVRAVVAGPEVTPSEVVDGLANLVAKSLIVAEVEGPVARYRLLDTTWAYALDRLVESGERERVARRHARHYSNVFKRAETEWETRPAAEWLDTYGCHVDNLRAALEWAFASDEAADRRVGAEIAALSMPLWLESSLHAEARLWAHQALNIAGLETRHEMMLQIALGTVLLKTEAASNVWRTIGAAFLRGLELAELGGDTEHSLRALYGLYVEALHANKYEQARGFAERFRALAEQIGSRADLRVGDRLIGTSTHYLGQTAQARMRLELWLKERSDLAQRPRESRFGFDQNVMGLATLARVLALQGELDRALELAEQAVDEARSLNRVSSLCQALGEQSVVALWIGQLDVLARASSALTIAVDRHGFGFWRPHALVSQAVLAGSGAAPGDPVLFGRALSEVGMDRFDLIYPSLTGVVALGLKTAGTPELGRKLINQALGRPGAMDRCFAPEMLLCSGLLATGNDLAHGVLLRSLEHARAQAAPLFELRAATALAQLEVGSGPDRAGMLRAALNRVKGGAGTLHVEAAKGVLGRIELDQRYAS